MSWSLPTLTVPDGTSIADAVNEAIEGMTTDSQKQIHTNDVQINQAGEAAEHLRDAVARSGDAVAVTLSGHYNKDLEPTPGWADCFISIRISQIPVTPEA